MGRTILIMAGGTGGHIFPGLAVADELRRRGWRVVWMGSKTGMEADIVPRNGYDMVWVRFGGVRGKAAAQLVGLPLRLLVAFWQAASAIRRVRPDVVLGMGGYISFPGGMMAALLGRPLAIHEQNAIAGTTSRLLAKLADRVMTSFECAFAPKARAELTGNPVRAALLEIAPPEVRFAERSGPLRLLVLGGSLGARALNEAVPRALGLIPEVERPLVFHQCGRAHFEDQRVAYRDARVQAEVEPFIEDMAQRLAWADLVVCRAGATTLAELTAVGVGAILVPFPFAIDDHQTRNAEVLAAHGAALLLSQRDLSPEKLARLLSGLDRARLRQMAEKARALGKPDAASRVADVCEALARRRVR